MNPPELTLTEANFDVETATGLVLVDFWAPRCPPCRRLGPIISKIAVAVTGRAKVGKCDVDDWPDLADRHGIKSIPTLLILQDGKEVDRLNGFHEERVVLERLAVRMQAGRDRPLPSSA